MNYRRLTRALIARVRALERQEERRQSRAARDRQRAERDAEYERDAQELADYHADKRQRALQDLDDALSHGDVRRAEAARFELGRHA